MKILKLQNEKKNLKIEQNQQAITPLSVREAKFNLGHVSSFFLELGVDWIIKFLNDATEDSDNTFLSILGGFLAGPTDYKLKKLLESVESIEKGLEKIDNELNHIDSLVTELCNKIIDLLEDSFVKDEFEKLDEIIQNKTVSYSDGWVAYVDLANYVKDLKEDISPENQSEIDIQIEGIINKLKLNTTFGAQYFYKSIKSMANAISDSFNGDLSSSVSEKPNQIGGHFEGNQTYVKAVLKKLSDTYPFEHQVYVGVLNEVNRVIQMQVQMITLYNEINNYLQKIDKYADVAKVMSENYAKVYNLTINSINNALEQSCLTGFMTPLDLNCTLLLSDDKSVGVDKRQFFRVRTINEKFNGDIYYVSKKSIPKMFVTKSFESSFHHQQINYDWNTSDNQLHKRYLHNDDQVLGALPQVTENNSVKSSQLTLFNTPKYIKEKGINDFLRNVGALPMEPENFEYILHDAPCFINENPTPPFSKIQHEFYALPRTNVCEDIYWYEFFWNKINQGVIELEKCNSKELAEKSTISMLIMKGIEKQVDGKLNFGYKVNVALNIIENPSFGTAVICDKTPATTDDNSIVYGGFAPKEQVKIKITLKPGCFIKVVQQTKKGTTIGDFAYYEPIIYFNDDISKTDYEKERNVELEFLNYFDSTQFNIFLDGSFAEVTTKYKCKMGTGSATLIGKYTLHNADFKSKGFLTLNGTSWLNTPITNDDFVMSIGSGTYKAYIIDQNDHVYYGNTVNFQYVSPV